MTETVIKAANRARRKLAARSVDIFAQITGEYEYPSGVLPGVIGWAADSSPGGIP